MDLEKMFDQNINKMHRSKDKVRNKKESRKETLRLYREILKFTKEF